MPFRERVGKLLGKPSAPSPTAHTTTKTGTVSVQQAQTPPTAAAANVQPQQSSPNPPVIASCVKPAGPSDCWGKAFERLEVEQPNLFKFYAQQLRDNGIVFSGYADQLQDLLQTRTSEREVKKLIINLQGKEIQVREYGEKIVKFVIWSKDLVSAATSAQPYAAIAMAGVSILLPLMLQPSTETSKMLEGLERVSSLVKLYELRARLYLSIPGDHATQIRDAIVQLYFNVLIYQASALKDLTQNKVRRGMGSIANPDRWKNLIEDVNTSADVCTSFEHFVDTTEERRLRQEQLLQSQQSHDALKAIKDLVDTMQNQQLRSLEHRDESAFFQAFSGPYSRDKNRNPERVVGTCEWFLRGNLFLKWRHSSTSRLLWLSADPGCGKSVLARCLVDEDMLSDNVLTTSVCYFFFKDDDEKRKLACHALTAIIHQLVVQNPSLLGLAVATFEKHRNSLTTDFLELWDLFMAMSRESGAGTIICLLDALDECETESRDELIRALTDFYLHHANSAALGVKFLITSRPYEPIKASFQDVARSVDYVHFDGRAQSDQISREIDLVIDYQIPRIASQLSRTDQMIVIEELKAVKSRTYLWAHLIFDVIKKRVAAFPTASRIRDGILKNIPSTLIDVYEDILSRIPPEEHQRARVLFQITLASRKPLSPVELITALESVVRTEASSLRDLDLPQESGCLSMIRDLCGLLLDVRDGLIVFLHQTAREFLIKTKDSTEPNSDGTYLWQHSIATPDSHRTMAIACMKVLNFSDFDRWPPWLVQVPDPFSTIKKIESRQVQVPIDEKLRESEQHNHPYNSVVVYAAQNWDVHYRDLKADMVSSPISQASTLSLLLLGRMLFQCESNHFAMWYTLRASTRYFERPNPLTLACRMNLLTLCRSLVYEDLQMSTHGRGTLVTIADPAEILRRVNCYETNPQLRRTPLLQACACSDVEVVKMLVEAGADIDRVKKSPTSPLAAACELGKLDIVRLLVERGAKTSQMDARAPATLYPAVWEKKTDVVSYLLARARFSEHEKMVSFLKAVSICNFEILDLFLATSIDLDGFDDGECAVFIAVRHGYVDLLRWLLDKGADLRIKDQYGQNVLCSAMERVKAGHAASSFGQTPKRLSGREMITHLLHLGVKVSDPNHTTAAAQPPDLQWDMPTWESQDWRTFAKLRYSNALHQAILCGSNDVVSELLTRGTSPDLVNRFHETTLALAEEARSWRWRFEQRTKSSKSLFSLTSYIKVVDTLKFHGAKRHNVGSDEVHLSLGPGLGALLDTNRRGMERYVYEWI